MDKMTLATLIFVAAPEGMLAYSVGLTLMSVRPVFKRMLVFAFLFAISAFLVRSLPLVPGIHTIILTFCSSIFIYFLYHISYKKALSAALLTIIFTFLGEILFIPLIIQIASLTYQDIMGSSLIRIMVSLPQQTFLAIVLFICYRLRGFHREKQHYVKRHKAS